MGISIKARSLYKDLAADGASTPILKGLDLEVKEGEFVAVLGPSGCGKTTLLGLLCGLDAPTSGEVLLGGMEVSSLSADQMAAIRNKEIGVVYQFFNLIATLTAVENVELPLQIRGGFRRAELRKQAVELLEAVGLSERLNHRLNQLSGGEQQRVAIARSLMIGPSVLLADEPTGNLDSQTGTEVMSYLVDVIRDRQLTAIVVTHDAKIASRAERILYMKDGAVVDEIVPDPKVDKAALIAQLNN